MTRSQIMVTLSIFLIILSNDAIILYYSDIGYAAGQSGNDDNLFITHGIASGDVTDHSAMIWSRANRQALMHVEYDTDQNFTSPLWQTVAANQTTDFTGHTKLEGLSPDTTYYYHVWFSVPDPKSGSLVSNSIRGTFHTAPSDSTSTPTISFIIGGDISGQGFCRRVDTGYSIFSIMKTLSADFFIFNGDQIYADNFCSKKGPKDVFGWQNIPEYVPSITDRAINWTNFTKVYDVYLDHWGYNRDDLHLQGLLQNISMYSQLDDHEVINDYGGDWDYWRNETTEQNGFPNLVKAGVDAFFNYSPIERNNQDPNRTYRSFNWGKDLELFILDTRSNRSRNDLPDIPENNKTLLGIQQLRWLEQGLLNSNATWKVISTSVPVSIPNCFNRIAGCDNWATDGNSTTSKTFVSEREAFLKFLDDNNIKNVVFVATDIHSPAVVNISHDANEDGDNLNLYELVSGPLSAIPLASNPLDPTINATYLYNESKIFNFGHINVQRDSNADVKLIYEVIDSNGLVRPNSRLSITAQ